MLKIKNLSKYYSDLHILKNINLHVEKGETVAIIGPSGSGKSTFLRCLNYLEAAQEGEIFFDEARFDLKGISQKDILNLRKHTSMVFQNYNLFKNKTALENILEYLIYVKKMPKNMAIDKAIHFLKMMKLEDKRDSYPDELSGGQQQRVGIARALAMEPDVMLLDEPTSSLDPELVKSILNIIRDLAKEKQTMIIVTHEMKFAKEVSDRMLFMESGRFLVDGTPDEVFRSNKVSTFVDKFNF